MTESDVMSDEMFFGCFASVEYISLKNIETLKSVCELECYVQNSTELEKLIIVIKLW